MPEFDHRSIDLDPRLLVVPEGESLEAMLGFHIEEPDLDADPVVWHAWFDVANRHLQPLGLVHGGVYAALAETLVSVGTVAAVAPEGLVAFGQSNLTHFLRPATAGRVRAEARPIHRGRRSWVWEVDMTDDRGRRLARTTVTMAVRRPR